MKRADFLFLSWVVVVVTGLAIGVSRPIALREQVQTSERCGLPPPEHPATPRGTEQR